MQPGCAHVARYENGRLVPPTHCGPMYPDRPLERSPMSVSEGEQSTIVAIALAALELAVKLAPLMLGKALAKNEAWKTLVDEVKAHGQTETDAAKAEAERNARGQ